jgi:hypothetical protein
MKAYWGSGGIDPHLLDLGTRWKCMVNFTPRPICPQGKSPWCTLDRRLSGPYSRFGHGGKEKNSQPLLGLEPPIIQPVAQRYLHYNYVEPLGIQPVETSVLPLSCVSFWIFFSIHHRVQTGSGAHPTSYTVGTGNKAAGTLSWSLISM